MRLMLRMIALATIITTTLPNPAHARSGCWHDGYSWRCPDGCWIVNHWYDYNGRLWINYFCLPSHEVLLLIALGGMVVCFFMGAAWFSVSRQKALRRQAAEADSETAAANTLANAADDLTREIDAYVETTKRTAYRRGRDSL